MGTKQAPFNPASLKTFLCPKFLLLKKSIF